MTTSADNTTKVYLGNGCFWHTQYEFYRVERAYPFLRKDNAALTALAGYAGSMSRSTGGLVCYHHGVGGPAGSHYHKLGHAETVQVTLDARGEVEQFKALLTAFFEHGFQKTSDGRHGRLDPQHMGPAYRINIGLPQGKRGPLYPLIEAANANKMRLVEGRGPSFDLEDDFVVYIYNNDVFPFYQAEKFQYHQKSVIRRRVPSKELPRVEE